MFRNGDEPYGFYFFDAQWFCLIFFAGVSKFNIIYFKKALQFKINTWAAEWKRGTRRKTKLRA